MGVEGLGGIPEFLGLFEVDSSRQVDCIPGLPGMTDCLKGEELVFAATYTFHPIRAIYVSSQELQTLTNEEVEPAVGSYDFRDIPDLIDHFIIWRSNRSSLLLEERSVERSFDFASLCLNFSPANVIPGTQFSFVDDKLILLVPTQNALYRFTFEIELRKKNEDQAILKLSEDQAFPYNRDSYELTSSKSACSANIVHTNSGTSAVYSLADGQIIFVQMRYEPGGRGQGYEKVIRGEGLLQRVMKAAHQLSLVVSLASCVNGKKEYDVNLYDMIIYNSDGGDGEQVSAEMVRTCSNASSSYVVVLFQIDDHCVFILGKIDPFLLSEHAGYFSFINTFQTESGIVDFTCAVQEDILDIICLCKISNGIRYSLRAASIDCLNGVLTVPWKGVNEIHSGDPEVSVLQAKSKRSLAAQKSHIFDPNRYPFGVVLRSLQFVKGAFNWKLLAMRQDWRMLKEAAEKYCSSVEVHDFLLNLCERFDQYYITKEDRSLLATSSSNQPGQDRFWTALTKMCNELIQNECLSLGLWHSVSLGLYGTVQQGRFTVCRPGDEQLLWFDHLIRNDEKNVKICWDIITKFAIGGLVASAISVEESEQFVNAFSTVSHIFEDAIRKFTELRPVDEFDLDTAETPFHGSFTVGLLATHFERLIDDRLSLSQCFIALMELETIPLDARWELTVNTHEKSLHDMNRQLSVLSQAMKLRISIDQHNEISLADGFFATAGLPTILSYAQNKELIGEEDDTEEDDEEIREDGTDTDVGKITYTSPLRQSTSAYSQFINRIVNDAVVVLWPENTAMVLARFLANYHQYSALQAYCQLNEPYITELFAAFRFFEGYALTGLGEPEKALQSFLDAVEGINREDEALNRMISPDGNVPDEPYNELQYLLKVMAVMEIHGFNEQLVYLSRRALNEALQAKHLHTRVLPGLYTSVFKFELITERYEDALNTLLSNPVPENRRICLRELVAKLIEQRKNAVIVDLNYGVMEQQVVNILKANARTSDISKEGYFYELIYAFHFRRDLFQRAALTMLEYSCRLQSELQNRNVLSRRSRALSIVVSLLSLLPETDQFLTLPAALVQKRIEQKMGKNALVIWTLSDISKRALLSSARLVLFDANYDPKEKKSIPPPIKLEEIFEQLIQKKLFDHAWEVSKVFDLKPYPLLKAVTEECIHLDAKPPKGESRWVAKNRKFLRKIPSLRERHWAILRGYVEVAMRRCPEDFKVLWTVTYVFLQYQWHIPPWLSNFYEDRCAAEYAYLLIMFDRISINAEVDLCDRMRWSRRYKAFVSMRIIDVAQRCANFVFQDAEQLKDYVERYFELIAFLCNSILVTWKNEGGRGNKYFSGFYMNRNFKCLPAPLFPCAFVCCITSVAVFKSLAIKYVIKNGKREDKNPF
ncbi:hypothetical protein DINM_004472 [Dirofilaria immitis]|nr:hypothetical protein [Dirofilaria immitis]